MAKHLKLNIKNTQIAQAINLGGLKDKLAKKKKSDDESAETALAPEKKPKKKSSKAQTEKEEVIESDLEKESAEKAEAQPKIKARSKSVFAEGAKLEKAAETPILEAKESPLEENEEIELTTTLNYSEELRKKIFGEEDHTEEEVEQEVETLKSVVKPEENLPPIKKEEGALEIPKEKPLVPVTPAKYTPPAAKEFPKDSKLGPTGRHVKDLFQAPKRPEPQVKPAAGTETEESLKKKAKVFDDLAPLEKKGPKAPIKEFRDVKPTKQKERFDARDRQGLRGSDEDQRWRKKRSFKPRQQEEIQIVRPTSLKVRTPISIKDLADKMKLKSSQLVSKLFMQGVIVTLNDLLDDETTIQLLGHEFGCEITLDTSEEERIRITDKSVKEEISSSSPEEIITRPPVVAFMGHVDHGKTSLIDAIRKSNRVAGEAGAITQHIGAFCCQTAVGNITILDTPGHEAFSAMRARGADVTDIVVLVVAGDEGIRQQTLEAIQHAKDAKVTIVVAINKADKPGFNPENVYRQLAENDLLPESWGGQILTVNCSAVTGAGVKELLETLALQAEILELKANPNTRARGSVLESEMHKGLGAVATVIVQNGTLRTGDALVFERHFGRVKTMRDDLGRELKEAPPSTPVEITGLSGLPDAGQEFIVVKNEKEARDISEVRAQGMRQLAHQQKKALTAENLLQQATPTTKKLLNIVLRADVQGSLEALKVALEKIKSDKAELAIIFAGVGEISESDIQTAATSKALVLGFHTKVEAHAESLIKQLNVQIKLHDIIYHAIDDVKAMMTAMLDKIPQETDKGKAEVRNLFKSSQAGVIAGCMVIEGTIHRNYHLRVRRGDAIVGKAEIASLRRVKEDVREVNKGMECGIVLGKFSDVQEGDILEAYEITYLSQEL